MTDDQACAPYTRSHLNDRWSKGQADQPVEEGFFWCLDLYKADAHAVRHKLNAANQAAMPLSLSCQAHPELPESLILRPVSGVAEGDRRESTLHSPL